MSGPIETSVKTIDPPAYGPADALARLLSHPRAGGCFLFESLAPDTEAGRYSVLGYRMQSVKELPPVADLEAALTSLEGQSPAPTFAEALANASVGFIVCDEVARAHGVRLPKEPFPAAMFLVRGAVMVFDHLEQRVHVAAPVQGNGVERLLWEVEHGTAAPLPTDPYARPAAIHRKNGEAKLRARAGRIQSLLGDELEAAVLGEALFSPLLGADAYGIYRALRQLGSATHGFFIDYGPSPLRGWQRVLGLSSTLLHEKHREPSAPRSGSNGSPTGAWSSIRDRLPHAKTYGTPPIVAATVLRGIEEEPRTLQGDAVGYSCAGGESSWVLAEQCIMVQDDSVICPVGAQVRTDSDPSAVAASVDAAAAVQLAALAAAQAAAPPET